MKRLNREELEAACISLRRDLNDALSASEARRVRLFEVGEERRVEWLRAERAEGERDLVTTECDVLRRLLDETRMTNRDLNTRSQLAEGKLAMVRDEINNLNIFIEPDGFDDSEDEAKRVAKLAVASFSRAIGEGEPDV